MSSSKPTKSLRKALVTVFEDLDSAKLAVELLNKAGFAPDQIELVTKDVRTEAPEIQTPKDHETTSGSMLHSAVEWAPLGAGIGAIGALVAPFPGVALAMVFLGAAAGAVIGSIAGVEHAVDDDSVNLPTIEEYERLVKNDYSLVVVLGSHEEAMKAEEVVHEIPSAHRHIHAVHGHEHHEHPTT